jgi:hypothetical protein
VVIAVSVLDKMHITRYGIQATSPCVGRRRTGNVINATLPCRAFISWAWRWIVKANPRNVISHVYQYTAVLLVVIPLSSDHNYLLCTASLHVHTFSGDDPTPGNSPSFSCVRRCKCPPHKPKTDCLTRVQAAFRPVLYAFLMYKSPCTTCSYTRSYVCKSLISSFFWTYKLLLAAVRTERCGRCGEEKHSYISLYGNVLDTGDVWAWDLSLLLAMLPIPVVSTFVVLIKTGAWKAVVTDLMIMCVTLNSTVSFLTNNECFFSAVGRGWAGRPDHDQQHCYHLAPTVKPEAATAVVAPDDGREDARNMSCI